MFRALPLFNSMRGVTKCSSVRPLGVRMANPRDVILLMIQPGEGQTLEHVHGLALLILGRCIFGCKGQNPVRVGPLPVDAVDQVAGPIHVALHDLWRRVAAAFLARQVFRNLTPATAPPPVNLISIGGPLMRCPDRR